MISLFMGVMDQSVISYATNFGNFVSSASITKSYIASGLCLALVWTIVSVFGNYSEKQQKIYYDASLFNQGRILLLLTLPPLFVDLVDQFFFVRSLGYQVFYTESFQSRNSLVPGIGLIRTLNTLAFCMVFAAHPSKRRYWSAAALFLLVAALDSLKGARSALLVPGCFILWHSVKYYNLRLGAVRTGLLISGAIAFLTIMALVRAPQDNADVSFRNFLIYGLSKGQYTLALVLDNYDKVEVDSVFAIEPLIFPLKYAVYGGKIVGQSETSATYRQDLNHTFSSQLNYDAYLSGAGIGSSYVAEAIQFGPLLMLLFVSSWLYLHDLYFRISFKFKTLALIQPIIFMHIVFSPRNSMFENTWPILKLLMFFFIVRGAFQAIKIVQSRQVTSA